MFEPNLSTDIKFLNSRPAFFPAPEFVFNLIFGKERASIVTQSQVAHSWSLGSSDASFQVVQPVRTLESGFEYRFPTIGNGHLKRQAQISPLLFSRGGVWGVCPPHVCWPRYFYGGADERLSVPSMGWNRAWKEPVICEPIRSTRMNVSQVRSLKVLVQRQIIFVPLFAQNYSRILINQWENYPVIEIEEI